MLQGKVIFLLGKNVLSDMWTECHLQLPVSLLSRFLDNVADWLVCGHNNLTDASYREEKRAGVVFVCTLINMSDGL